MPQTHSPLSSIVRLAAIERPACPRCRAQMMLARIVPAFVGTYLHRFGCAACNHVLETLAAHDNCRDATLALPGAASIIRCQFPALIHSRHMVR